jgi:DNA-binding NarL/FixJ family response regulator
VARVRNVVRRQERLLAEAARYADADIGQMARQITEIRSLLQQTGSHKSATPATHSFTPREASVLQLVAEGLMNKEIARRLETSIRNVEKYVSRLFTKTGTTSRTELVRYALENGLVD